MNGLLPAAKWSAANLPRHCMVSVGEPGLPVAKVSTVVRANRSHSCLASVLMNAFAPRHGLSVRWRPARRRHYAKRVNSAALAARHVAKGCNPKRGLSVLRRPANGLSLPRPTCGHQASRSCPSLHQAHCGGSSSSPNSGAVAYSALMEVWARSLQLKRHREQAQFQYKYTGQSVWPNPSVEATSNGWPHMASCSFSALCGQPLAAPHVER
jgi:hypothetical protein